LLDLVDLTIRYVSYQYIISTERMASIPEIIKEPIKYQENLKAFLTLAVTAPKVRKVKSFSKQYKSYAEALGLPNQKK